MIVSDMRQKSVKHALMNVTGSNFVSQIRRPVAVCSSDQTLRIIIDINIYH